MTIASNSTVCRFRRNSARSVFREKGRGRRAARDSWSPAHLRWAVSGVRVQLGVGTQHLRMGVDAGDFVDMIGFPKVWEFEEKYADLLAEDQI